MTALVPTLFGIQKFRNILNIHQQEKHKYKWWYNRDLTLDASCTDALKLRASARIKKLTKIMWKEKASYGE